LFRGSSLIVPSIPGNESTRWAVGSRATIFEKEDTMTSLGKTLASAALGAGLMAITTMSASAAIVCSGNTCWHTHEVYRYPPEARVIVHDDDWRWGPREHFVFREHEGRGFWRGDTWENR
jgi:hypothetical protein